MDAAHPIAVAWTWTSAHAWATVGAALVAVVAVRYAANRARRERNG